MDGTDSCRPKSYDSRSVNVRILFQNQDHTNKVLLIEYQPLLSYVPILGRIILVGKQRLRCDGLYNFGEGGNNAYILNFGGRRLLKEFGHVGRFVVSSTNIA